MDRMNTRRLPAVKPVTEKEMQDTDKAKECGLLFRESYHETRSRIPGNQRGYFYTLKNGVYVQGTPCDIEIAYDIVTPATSLLDNYKAGELETLIKKLGSEFGVVPFFKIDAETLTPDMIRITEMGMLARFNPELAYFLVLSERLGLVYKKSEMKDGNLFGFQRHPVAVVEGLDKKEKDKIDEKQKELYQRLS